MNFDEMILQHKNQMYPPRVTMTVTMKTTDPKSLLITFSGSLMSDHCLNTKLTVPLGMYTIAITMHVLEIIKVYDIIIMSSCCSTNGHKICGC